MDDGVPFFVPCLFSGFSGIREFLENKRSFRDILSYISGVFLSFIITSRKLRIIKEINNKLGRSKNIKIFGEKFWYVRTNYSTTRRNVEEESWEISGENYRLNVSREIVSPVPRDYRNIRARSIDRCSFAISRLCARIDEFFTKPNASVLKRFYFIPPARWTSLLSVFVIRHLHSTCIFLIVFKSTAREWDESRDIHIRIFAIYPYDIDDTEYVVLARILVYCYLIWRKELRILELQNFF